jgi:hypothetical protein
MQNSLESHFIGHKDFKQWIRVGLFWAVHAGVQRIILSDPDYADWPLGERALTVALHEWALKDPKRRVTVLAASYNEIVRRHGLFVKWRVQWDHQIECLIWNVGKPEELPSLLWTPQWALRRDDLRSCRGQAGRDPNWLVITYEQIQEKIDRSTIGFPATIIGL